MPAGRRISLAPDSFLVRSASRHSITDAGFGKTIGGPWRADEKNAAIAAWLALS